MHYDKNMLYIAQMEKGERIYHYTTIDALISIVSRKELWVTKWDYLNDMDELKVALDGNKRKTPRVVGSRRTCYGWISNWAIRH